MEMQLMSEWSAADGETPANTQEKKAASEAADK